MGKSVNKFIGGVEYKFHAFNIKEIRAVTKLVDSKEEKKDLDTAFEVMNIAFARAEVVGNDIKPAFDDLEIGIKEIGEIVQDMMVMSDLSDPNPKAPAVILEAGPETPSPKTH